MVRHRILVPGCLGSSPNIPIIRKAVALELQLFLYTKKDSRGNPFYLHTSLNDFLFGHLDLHPFVIGIPSENAHPPVDADERDYCPALVLECVDLLQERVQIVLIRDDQKRKHFCRFDLLFGRECHARERAAANL